MRIDLSRINKLASAEIKKDENGMLELSNKLNIPISFVEIEKLRLFESQDIQKSEFVKSKFGIYGVCYDGVTVAIAVSK